MADFLIDVDPDDNFLSEIMPSYSIECQSNYYTIDRYNAEFRSANGSLMMLNFNVRSFKANGGEFVSFLNCQLVTPDVIVLTETWFKDDTDTVEIDGYTGLHTIRREGRGGGVSVYTSNKFCAVKIDDCSVCDKTVESCAVRISIGSESYFVLAIYRPHSDTILNFGNRLDEMLQGSNLGNSKTVLTGDLNINLLNEECVDTCSFITMLQTMNFLPAITKPTRFPSGDVHCQPTTLDHIWINGFQNYVSGIISLDITDHCPTFISIKTKIQDCGKVKVSFRDHTPSAVDNFLCLLGKIEWQFCGDVSSDVKYFIDSLSRLYNRSFPMKVRFIGQKRLNKPWLSAGLMKSIRTKSRYFKLYKLGLISRELNNKYKNQLTKLLRTAKRLYYLTKFRQCTGDASGTWKLIRKILSSNNTDKSVKQLVVEGSILDSETNISEAFNDYFVSISSALDERVPRSDRTPLYSMKGDFPHSLFMYPVTSDEVMKIIGGLKSGICNKTLIPAFLLKKTGLLLLSPIARLINSSFKSGVFPDVLKDAQIVPVHKSGSETEMSNYRPISVLSYVSKIFEKCISNRIIAYANKCKILCVQQYGFLRGKSTADALISLSEYVYGSLNEKKHTTGIFVDLKKAFDTVNHEILLCKLEYYGIRGLALRLLTSYLQGRRQAVRIGSTISNYKALEIGIPQGSNLGPLLFLFYINDLPNVCDIFAYTLFADDTTLLASDHCYERLITRVNEGVKDVVEWTHVNRLTINVSKTVALLFSNRPNDIDLNNSLVVDGEVLPFDCKVKYLGVMVDSRLKFDEHMNHVCNKLSRSVGILYKLRLFAPESVLISCYYSLIYPYLDYCVVVWGGASKVHIDKLVLLQKRALRVITNSSYREHTNPLFIRTRILKLEDLYKFELCIYMYKRCALGEIVRAGHSYDTRKREDAIPVFQRLSLSQNSLSYAAPRAWNALPDHLRCMPNLNRFKSELKAYLLSNYG